MTDTDKLLSKKYKEMAGYYNILNVSNNTILEGNVTFLSSLYVSKNSTFFNKVTTLTNLNVLGNSIINNNLTVGTLLNADDCIVNKNFNNSGDTYVIGSLFANGGVNTSYFNLQNSNFYKILNVNCESNITGNLYAETIYISSQSININGKKINIGTTNSVINLNGTSLYIINNNILCNDKLITVNNNPTNNGGDCGIQILGISGNGFIKTLPSADRFIIKAPYDDNFKYLTTLDVNNNLKVSGYSLFKESVTINSSLDVLSDITYQDNTEINLNLYVSNVTTFSDNITMMGNINVGGKLTYEGIVTSLGNLYVNGDTVFNDMDINSNVLVLGSVYIVNSSTFNSTLNLYGNSIFNDNVTINSTIYISNNSNINGNTTINSNLNIVGNATINGDCDIQSNLIVYGNNNHNNNVTINSNIVIGGDTIIDNNIITGVNNSSIFNISGTLVCPLREFESNSFAALNNVPVYGFYRTGGVVKIRLDVIPPVIDLNNITNTNIIYNSIYTDPGVYVTDNYDDNIIPYIISIENNNVPNIISSPIPATGPTEIVGTNLLEVGVYYIIYNASDIVGNTTSINRTLNIVPI